MEIMKVGALLMMSGFQGCRQDWHASNSLL